MSAETLTTVGESWGGYTVLEALGHLGLAERYRVRGGDGRIHLLDVIAMQHPTLLKRLQEANLEQIVHPNLLAVREVVSVLRFPGVVCADTPGITLHQWRRTNPSVEDRLLVVRDIARGLSALHAAGKHHGFLQPSIVIVEQHRHKPVARLGLPGVAAVVFSILREGGTVSTSGASLGGASFQAPEQQRSPSKADQRSDLFSLGCLMYYLLTGRSPFDGLDLLSCYEAALAERYEPITTHLPDISKDIASLLQDLLRAEPAARPTANDVAERIGWVLPPESNRYGTIIGLTVALALTAALAWMLVSLVL